MNAVYQLAQLVGSESPDSPDPRAAAITAVILPDAGYSDHLLREIALTALIERREDLAEFLLGLRRLSDLSVGDFVAEVGMNLPELHLRAGVSPTWAPEFTGLEIAPEEWPDPPVSAQAELLDMLCISAALGEPDATDLLSRLLPIPADLRQLHLSALLRLGAAPGSS